MKLRPACVAGHFYEEEKEALKAQVLECLPKPAPKREEALGGVVPHAGLMYSGEVAGSVYGSVRFPATFVLLGPNHTGEGPSLSLSACDAWETPFGRTEVDGEFIETLLKEAPQLKREDAAHRREHSLEVQLPFIQVLEKESKIVPILLGFCPGETCRRLGEALAKVILHFSRKVLVLASSDLTHYEPQEVVQEKDAEAIEAIIALNEIQLMKRVRERSISMCGTAATVTMLACVKQLGAKKGELLQYQTSGEKSGDTRSVVGYAGILIH